jgi:pyruvate dehydrogenase E2 component (dihydrolipoamide acetyltransferase)
MELKLPLLGDVMTEGRLAAWLQPAGAFVSAGSPLYELETDKVRLTVEAPESGVLERLILEGQTVPVGTVVGRLAAPVGHEAGDGPGQDAGSSGGASSSAATELGDAGAPAPQKAGVVPAEVRASPAARRMAKQLGVDLAKIGTTRRIREADVQAYASTRAERRAQEPPDSSAALTGRRKLIAERMRSSLQQTAQFTISMEVDMSAAIELRAQLNQLLAEAAQPTITDLVMRATALALCDHRRLNATFEDGRLRLHDEVHIGLAVDADEGLIVPVIHNAHALPLTTLSEQTKLLAQRARDNHLSLDQLQGGTFTITSLGPLGVDFFTPILNPPQVAILGIGRLFSKLVLDRDRPVERQAMYLNLSFDHQVLDGAPAARFLQRVKSLLELPAALIL